MSTEREIGLGVAILAIAGMLVYFARRRVAPDAPAQPVEAPRQAPKPVTKVAPSPAKDVVKKGDAPRKVALPVPTSGSSGGLLLAALRAGTTEPLTWTAIDVDGMKVEVANDAMKGPAAGQMVRLPMTYDENVEAAKILADRGMQVIVPNQAIADAMYAQATAKGHNENQDTATMMSLASSLKWNQAVEAQLAKMSNRRLFVGPWKFWVLDKDITTDLPPAMFMGKLTKRPPAPRAVNFGIWGLDGKPIQTLGRWHNAAHYDYSQAFVPVKRFATAADGSKVDLLSWMETPRGGSVSPAATARFRNDATAFA